MNVSSWEMVLHDEETSVGFYYHEGRSQIFLFLKWFQSTYFGLASGTTKQKAYVDLPENGVYTPE